MAIVDVLGVETAVKESCDPQPTILLSRKVLVIQPPSVVGVATSQSQLTLSIREAIVGPKKVPLVLTQLVMNHLVVKHLVLVDAQISSARLSPPLQRDPLWVRLEGAAEAQGTGPANPALHGQREGFKPSALDEQGRLLVLARTHEQILAQPAALSSPKGRIGVALVLLVLCRGEGPARKYDSILFMEQRKARPILGIIGSRGHLPGEEHGGPLPSASPDQNEADDFRQQDAARVRSPDDEVGGLEVKLDLRPLHQHDGEDAEEGEVHLEVQQRDVWKLGDGVREGELQRDGSQQEADIEAQPIRQLVCRNAKGWQCQNLNEGGHAEHVKRVVQRQSLDPKGATERRILVYSTIDRREHPSLGARGLRSAARHLRRQDVELGHHDVGESDGR
mmetsp:Transcript_18403/g.69615  ORF Transcript_18403/g.69615 Transcript_18403/m.69615 type:complete len:392 (+) Transcript_18403:949-2124(+)